MCSKQNRRFKFKCFLRDNRNNWTKNINKTYHANVDVNLIAENVIQIKSEITINVGGGAKMWKNNICAKNITFGILLHALVKMPVILFLNKEENYYLQVKKKIDLKKKKKSN